MALRREGTEWPTSTSSAALSLYSSSWLSVVDRANRRAPSLPLGPTKAKDRRRESPVMYPYSSSSSWARMVSSTASSASSACVGGGHGTARVVVVVVVVVG